MCALSQWQSGDSFTLSCLTHVRVWVCMLQIVNPREDVGCSSMQATTEGEQGPGDAERRLSTSSDVHRGEQQQQDGANAST